MKRHDEDFLITKETTGEGHFINYVDKLRGVVIYNYQWFKMRLWLFKREIGEGVINPQNPVNVVYEWPMSLLFVCDDAIKQYFSINEWQSKDLKEKVNLKIG